MCVCRRIGEKHDVLPSPPLRCVRARSCAITVALCVTIAISAEAASIASSIYRERPTTMRQLACILGIGVTFALVAFGQSRPPLRHFTVSVNLEQTSEDSANVSAGDLDGDGDLDLVLAKGRHTPLLDRVLLNDGHGKFVASDLGPTPDRTYSAVLADIDGDGDLDVLTSNDEPDRKLVYLNDGKAHFRVAGTWGIPQWSTRNATMADLDGDGRPDVIAANRPGPSYACLNDRHGRFPSACIKIPMGSATSAVAADFNRDGAIDIAIPNRDEGQSAIFFNDGRA